MKVDITLTLPHEWEVHHKLIAFHEAMRTKLGLLADEVRVVHVRAYGGPKAGTCTVRTTIMRREDIRELAIQAFPCIEFTYHVVASS